MVANLDVYKLLKLVPVYKILIDAMNEDEGSKDEEPAKDPEAEKHVGARHALPLH